MKENYPNIDTIIKNSLVINIPMKVKFRGITNRTIVLIQGDKGWGEFSPFSDYSLERSIPWLKSALESAYENPKKPKSKFVEINGTIPAVSRVEVEDLIKNYRQVNTVKVKVGENGQTWKEDKERLKLVADYFPTIRIDVNGEWDVKTALNNLEDSTKFINFEYVEQPCKTIEELAELKKELKGEILIAADESIRLQSDPLKVVEENAADIAVLKYAPLGGFSFLQKIKEKIQIPIVLSSALDSPVGIDEALIAATYLVNEHVACGLGTEKLFTDIFTTNKEIIDGKMSTVRRNIDTKKIGKFRADDLIASTMLEKMRKVWNLLS